MIENGSDILKVVKERRSVRKFLKDDVPKRLVQEIIRLSQYAPSAHNSQPTRYVVLNRCPTRDRLIRKMGEALDRDLRKDGFSEMEINQTIDHSRTRFKEVPIILVACFTMTDMDKYPDERSQAEYTMAIQSTAASIQTLLLAATANGLGTCWMCAPLFCKEIIRQVLSLPEDFDPQAFILLGYPSEIPEIPQRKPYDRIVHIINE